MVPTLSKAELQSPEPACLRPSTIVCEDFETDDRSRWSDYANTDFSVASDDAFAGQRSLRQSYTLGQVQAGWLAFFFGDHPRGADARSGEKLEEVYFRWYHKFQAGWPDSYPPKMARLRSHYIDCDWCFAWKEHFWITGRGLAHSDPVTNIPYPDGTEYTTDQRWLGIRNSNLDFTQHDGEWLALEMRLRLNSPGQDDGRITFWADGEVIMDRSGENLRGAYTQTTINVAMIDTYWNAGSPEEGLLRWYDNVVVATEPIGCAAFTVEKSPLANQSAWQLQVALDGGSTPVWDSGPMEGPGTRVSVSSATGSFQSGVSTCIKPGQSYVMRARHAQADNWSDWSDWTPVF